MRRTARVALQGMFVGLVALALGGRGANAEELWTLLPAAEWDDEFSPVYTNGSGMTVEGDPLAPDFDWPAIISYAETDPETDTVEFRQAVENEAVVNFRPEAPAATIRALFEAHGLKILYAWYEPTPESPETSLSWFHVQVLPASAFRDNVAGLLAMLSARPDVESAGYNDVMTLCGNPPYTSGPNDPLYSPAGSNPNLRHIFRSQLDAAWKDTSIPWGAMADVVSTVCVMDTGVDVDHADLHRSVWRYSTTSLREGISASGSKVAVGSMPDRELVKPATGVSPHKIVDLAKRGHGHGTAMAGVIAARTDNAGEITAPDVAADAGVPACGPTCSVLSGRMRMVGNDSVDFASYGKVVKKLTKHYGATGKDPASRTTPRAVHDVRVVYLGFEAGTSYSKAMSQMLKMMRKDRDAGNDRIWVAPAGNNRSSAATMPSALLNGRRRTNAQDPEILGVTAVVPDQIGSQNPFTDSIDFSSSNFFSPSPTLNQDVYDVSAYGFTELPTVDVNDAWYSAADLRSAHQQSAGYSRAARDLTAPRFADRSAPNGTSSAAAQIAGLAGLMWKRFPYNASAQNTAVNFGIHIRRLTLKTGTVAPNFTVGGVGFWSISSVQNPAILVPDVADFHKAIGPTAVVP